MIRRLVSAVVGAHRRQVHREQTAAGVRHAYDVFRLREQATAASGEAALREAALLARRAASRSTNSPAWAPTSYLDWVHGLPEVEVPW